MSAARMRGAKLAVLGLAAAVALAAGCATKPSVPDVESLPRPEWKVGDRWVFQRTTTAGRTAVVTHQVTAAGPDGYTLRITGLAEPVTQSWTPELSLARQAAAGRTSRFEPAAPYFAWPLTLGKRWEETFEFRDGRQDGRYVNSWRAAAGVEPVNVLAGSFYALRIEHWGGRGERLDTYWYTPRVRYWVRLENYQAGYTEELVEFVGSRP